MNPLTRQYLEEILSSGNFSLLIGQYESEWFECKKEPYFLKSDKNNPELNIDEKKIEKNKYEILKDISSFANVDGGYILIGIKAKGNDMHSGDEIVSISYLEENIINSDQYVQFIEAGIYPIIKGLEIKWYTSKDEVRKGLFVIKIPPQSNELKPFLTNKTLAGDRVVSTSVGLFQRRGDRTSNYEIKDLHKLIKLGEEYGKNTAARFDSLEATIKQLIDTSTKEDIEKKKIAFKEIHEERIEITLNKTQQDDKPNLVLSAYLEGNFSFKETLADTVQSLSNTTTQPLRNGGWKLLYSSDYLSKSRNLIELGYNSKSLSLYDDGTVIYITNLDQIALINDSRKIIPIALIEVVYQFADLYKHFTDYVVGEFKINFRIDLNNLLNQDEEIELSWDMKPMHHFQSHQAEEDSMSFELSADKDFQAGILAFEIINTIYSWFELNTPPPFSTNENGVEFIDLTQIAH